MTLDALPQVIIFRCFSLWVPLCPSLKIHEVRIYRIYMNCLSILTIHQILIMAIDYIVKTSISVMKALVHNGFNFVHYI